MIVPIVQWLVAGCVVAGVATAVIRAVPATAAAERHLLWWSALLAVLLLPVVAPMTAVFANPDAGPLAAASGDTSSAALTIAEPSSVVLTALLALWGASLVHSVARLAAGFALLGRLSDDATPLAGWPTAGVRGSRVLVSERIGGACAVGFFRPRIIVSAALVRSLDAAMLESIVAHEGAHLARYDDWSRLLQRLILAVAGLHPAVRWISRQIDIEREAACDRYVVDTTGLPLEYAKSLAAAADVAQCARVLHPSIAPGVSLVGGGLHARVTRVLSASGVSRGLRIVASTAGLVAVTLAAAWAVSLPPVVAIRALAEPLDVLVSAPLGANREAWLPSGRTSVLDATADARPAASLPASGPAVALRQVSEERAAEISSGAARETPAVHDVAPAVVQPALAPARPLNLLHVPTPTPAAGEGASGIGATATRMGVATADASSRAGQAIGRFFTRRGQAIANRF